jgi:TetR/AcrR family transcriptional regulator
MMGIRERKEREKEARHEEILNAAESVFFSKGLSEATMDHVAAEAELSKGTLYLYFRSKEDIYLAVSLRGMEILRTMFEQAASTDTPVIQRIEKLEDAYYAFFLDHRKYFRMFNLFENPDFQTHVSPDMMEQCAVSDSKLWKVVIDLIQEGIDQGMLHKGLDPLEVAVMLWSNANGLMRLMDRMTDYWKQHMGVDLDAAMRKSNRFLLEAMMTDKAKKEYGSLLMYHGTNEG